MMGFVGQNIAHVGEVPLTVAEPEPVEVMLQFSTINQISWICWALGLSGGETDSSS